MAGAGSAGKQEMASPAGVFPAAGPRRPVLAGELKPAAGSAGVTCFNGFRPRAPLPQSHG